jgi:folate-binding protein YgfZ
VWGRLGVEPPAEQLEHRTTRIGGVEVRLLRVDMTTAGSIVLDMPLADCQTVRQALIAAGATACSRESLEAVRIEAGFPLFGQDITRDNLPQEVARDQQAISFVKGCYIGQETVARIDALGHVNKTLVGLVLDNAHVPAIGSELTTSDGKVVGQITSAAWSPRLSSAVALAYVRRGSNEPGTTLGCGAATASVTRLPMRISSCGA